LWGSVILFFFGLALLIAASGAGLMSVAAIGTLIMPVSLISMLIALFRRSPASPVRAANAVVAGGENDEIPCPACGSGRVHVGQRGYTLTTGLLGATGVQLTCLKCGHKFEPGRDDVAPFWSRDLS
jgi:DNA-directed RNA polymerase subunit RPC12/RpoP